MLISRLNVNCERAKRERGLSEELIRNMKLGLHFHRPLREYLNSRDSRNNFLYFRFFFQLKKYNAKRRVQLQTIGNFPMVL